MNVLWLVIDIGFSSSQIQLWTGVWSIVGNELSKFSSFLLLLEAVSCRYKRIEFLVPFFPAYMKLEQPISWLSV